MNKDKILGGGNDIEVRLFLEGKVISGRADAMESPEVDIIVKTDAEIKLVNAQVFKFIQTLSKGHLESDKKHLLIEKLRQIERSLDFKLEQAQKM